MINKIPSRPLEKIALSCSGGGYRAASFHLGALTYLHRITYKGKPLLENVKLLSTVSGGTITGVVYALKKQEGKSFKEIYDFLLDKLHTLDLIKMSIQILNPGGGLKNPYKRKNLINAFAELYDEHFTKGATFGVFNTMTSHLDAVVFNSTEFNNGINFRFRNKGTGYFGNNMIRVSQAIAEEVKLADAMAASACFPGGFEPMIWPHDFAHDQSLELLAQLQAGSPMVGVMDGGVYDNQGIQSILLYKKSEDLPYFDLVIISDVASPYMNPFKPFAEKKKEGFRNWTLNTVKRKLQNFNRKLTLYLLSLIAFFIAVPFFWNYSSSFLTGLCIGIATALLAAVVLRWRLSMVIKKVILYLQDTIVGLIPSFYRSKLRALKIDDLSVHRMEPLFFDRLNSIITLLMDVFLKVVRRLNYGDLYNDEKFTYRRMSNLIKELTEEDFNKRKGQTRPETLGSESYQANSILRLDYDEVVGGKIKAVADEAASFGTTLWFTEDQQLSNMLDKLLATGEFTMCYNLIDYLEQILFVPDNGFEVLDGETQFALKTLYHDCIKDWNRFKENPMFLVSEMKN